MSHEDLLCSPRILGLLALGDVGLWPGIRVEELAIQFI